MFTGTWHGTILPSLMMPSTLLSFNCGQNDVTFGRDTHLTILCNCDASFICACAYYTTKGDSWGLGTILVTVHVRACVCVCHGPRASETVCHRHKERQEGVQTPPGSSIICWWFSSKSSVQYVILLGLCVPLNDGAMLNVMCIVRAEYTL